MYNSRKSLVLIFILIICIIFAIGYSGESFQKSDNNTVFRIIASTENRDLENVLQDVADQNKIELEIDYAGTLEIMDILNEGTNYDAVWTSNSIWLYMLNDDVSVKNSKSTSINPVVFGIKKSKAEELGFTNKEVYTKDIVEAIKDKKLTFNMSSATQTNTGSTAYLGFLSTLAGNPEVLTSEMLEDDKLRQDLVTLLSGVTRSSGSDEFLEEMFLNGEYDAVVTYEASIININKKLQQQNKEPLYIIYPVDGVSISDSPLAYVDNKSEQKLEMFEKIQGYILSDEGQNELQKTGRRVWYGGINENVDKTIFNPEWGIDTTKYIVPIKYPSTAVIKDALALYQTELRKPTHTIFCLDYSGSMYGSGIRQLRDAMEYILDEETASENLVQFSKKDKITVIPFSSSVLGKWSTIDGTVTNAIIQKISTTEPNGGTNLYGACIEALKILKEEDSNTYNLSIVLMTDGLSNVGTIRDLEKEYKNVNKDIPIFSIMFGQASSIELSEIAELSNAKVFDGRTNLLKAFKEVRGYN